MRSIDCQQPLTRLCFSLKRSNLLYPITLSTLCNSPSLPFLSPLSILPHCVSCHGTSSRFLGTCFFFLRKSRLFERRNQRFNDEKLFDIMDISRKYRLFGRLIYFNRIIQGLFSSFFFFGEKLFTCRFMENWRLIRYRLIVLVLINIAIRIKFEYTYLSR